MEPGKMSGIGDSFSPGKFLFGVANAPYLCEGGYNDPDGIKNCFAIQELNGKMERSGEASRFWTHYEDQIKLAASLGLNAFRMGIDWCRVQPTTSLDPHAPPAWDEQAVDHYAEIIATLFKYNLEPVITLHHFTHPTWLGLDMWLDDPGPNLLVEYELRIVEEINTRLLKSAGKVMKHFLVYNEANLVPLIFFYSSALPIERQGTKYVAQGFDNLFSRYVKIYDGLHDMFEQKGWGEVQVGFSIASMCMYSIDKIFLDLMRVRTMRVKRSEVDRKLAECRRAWYRRIDPLARRKLTFRHQLAYKAMVAYVQRAVKPSALTKTLDALYASPREKKLDYLSLSMYDPFNPVKGSSSVSKSVPWWEYKADPEIYRTFIHAYQDFNDGLPVYMGENTLAYKQPIGGKAEPRPDGWTREGYLKTHLTVVKECIQEGIPIQGYLYWSLVDDYEWDAGYPPRLGLYNYDYVNHKILPTDGLGEPAGEIYAGLIAALRSGDEETIARAFARKAGTR